MKKQVIFDKNHHIISVEVANNDTKSSASSETEPLPTEPETEMPLLPDDLSGLPKVSWDQKDIAIVLDPSMIPPEHDNNYPIIGGIAVSRILLGKFSRKYPKKCSISNADQNSDSQN